MSVFWLEGSFQQGSALLQHENYCFHHVAKFLQESFTTRGRVACRDSEFQRLRFVSSRRLWLSPRSSGTLFVGLVGLVISSLCQLVTALNENYFFRILENLAWRRKGRRQLSKCFQLNEYTLQKMFDHPTNTQEEREKRGV